MQKVRFKEFNYHYATKIINGDDENEIKHDSQKTTIELGEFLNKLSQKLEDPLNNK